MLRLRVTPAEGDPFEREIEDGPLVIGRSASAGLAIADPFLSRRQARLFLQDGRWQIEDLGSRNGTWVDGVRIDRPTPLTLGSRVTFSESRIAVVAVDGVAAEGEVDGAGHPPRDPAEDGPGKGAGAAAATRAWATVFRPATEVLAQELPAGRESGEVEIEPLRRRAARLQLLTEIHRALGRPIALDELLRLILDRVFDLLRPEEGMIFLRDAEGELEIAARRSRAGSEGGGSETGRSPESDRDSEETVLRSRTLEHEVVDKGLAALALDAREDARFAAAESLRDFGVRSLLAAPLLTEEGGALGMIVLTSGRNVRIYTDEDLSLLVSVASVAALRIRNVALAREAFERRRLERELALARRIQVALHAAALPVVPGWEIYARNRPSQGVSGDIYQVLERRVPGNGDGPRNELVLMVADVAGKGISASILTATLEALAAGPIEEGLPVEEIALWLSRQLRRRTPPEKYSTLFLAALDTGSGLLRWVSAGHPPALWIHPAGSEIETAHLDACGPPVGLVEAEPYPAAETRLAPGDTLVLYTDGTIEAADAEGRELGTEGLETLCRRYARRPLSELAGELDRELEWQTGGDAPEDDRTLVVVRREPEGSAAAGPSR